MTRQSYVGKKLLGHCTSRVYAISKKNLQKQSQFCENWTFESVYFTGI